MFGSLGPLEIMIIFVIVLVVFGADRLPELARGLGKGLREFKRAADDVKREIMIDPDLNLDLDLNEPLPKETKAVDDPYKHDDWENEDSEAVKQPDESNLHDENVSEDDKTVENLNIESDFEDKTEKKEETKNSLNNNNFSEENSEKQNLAG